MCIRDRSDGQKELFPEQLADVDETMFYRAINKAEPSLIRTEADELTYCLHIMVRYEIEKQLIGGTLAVKDVPAEWKRLYKKYLGVDVPSDREGCLQDSHWSGGSIGYFPSYALGSAYGAQMLHKMQEEIGVERLGGQKIEELVDLELQPVAHLEGPPGEIDVFGLRPVSGLAFVIRLSLIHISEPTRPY